MAKTVREQEDRGVAADAAALPPSGLSHQSSLASQAKPAAANAWTAGPWAVVVDYRRKGDRIFVTAAAPDGRVIICQTGFGHKPPVAVANARLIAAAPDLYEALAALVEEHIARAGAFDEPCAASEQTPEINNAVAALARARGEDQGNG